MNYLKPSMIIGIGVDVVYLKRIEKVYSEYGDRFLNRIFTTTEIANIPPKRKIEFISGRFALKEAIIKAASPAFISFNDIEIIASNSGKPYVNTMEKIFSKIGLKDGRLHISISHDADIAIGFAIIEKIL